MITLPSRLSLLGLNSWGIPYIALAIGPSRSAGAGPSKPVVVDVPATTAAAAVEAAVDAGAGPPASAAAPSSK